MSKKRSKNGLAPPITTKSYPKSKPPSAATSEMRQTKRMSKRGRAAASTEAEGFIQHQMYQSDAEARRRRESQRGFSLRLRASASEAASTSRPASLYSARPATSAAERSNPGSPWRPFAFDPSARPAPRARDGWPPSPSSSAAALPLLY